MQRKFVIVHEDGRVEVVATGTESNCLSTKLQYEREGRLPPHCVAFITTLSGRAFNLYCRRRLAHLKHRVAQYPHRAKE